MVKIKYFLNSVYIQIHNHGHSDRVPMPITSSHPKQAQLDAWYWQRRRSIEPEEYGIDLDGIEPSFDADEEAAKRYTFTPLP